MFRILSAREAAGLVKDGDCLAINSFLVLSNPEALHDALYQRFAETGAPKDLRLFCAAGFGGRDWIAQEGGVPALMRRGRFAGCWDLRAEAAQNLQGGL